MSAAEDIPILAMVPADELVPLDLFVTVLEALSAVTGELEQLATIEIVLPDEVVAELRERAALLVTLRDAPEALKVTLRERFKVNEVGADVYVDLPDGPRVPVDPEVVNQSNEVWELLRRAALSHPGIDAALRRPSW